MAPAVPDRPEQFIAVDAFVRDERAQLAAQRLGQVFVGVDRQDPLPAGLFVGEDRGDLGVTDERAHEDPASVTRRYFQRPVLALAVVHEHDLIHHASKALQAAADDGLLVAHHHTITMGRNGHMENLLAGEEILTRAGIAFHPTDRGGDVTYHGPGQIVGYPILDLREWQRDVGAYVRATTGILADAGSADTSMVV